MISPKAAFEIAVVGGLLILVPASHPILTKILIDYHKSSIDTDSDDKQMKPNPSSVLPCPGTAPVLNARPSKTEQELSPDVGYAESKCRL